jgi:hypothetical protein
MRGCHALISADSDYIAHRDRPDRVPPAAAAARSGRGGKTGEGGRRLFVDPVTGRAEGLPRSDSHHDQGRVNRNVVIPALTPPVMMMLQGLRTAAARNAAIAATRTPHRVGLPAVGISPPDEPACAPKDPSGGLMTASGKTSAFARMFPLQVNPSQLPLTPFDESCTLCKYFE